MKRKVLKLRLQIKRDEEEDWKKSRRNASRSRWQRQRTRSVRCAVWEGEERRYEGELFGDLFCHPRFPWCWADWAAGWWWWPRNNDFRCLVRRNYFIAMRSAEKKLVNNSLFSPFLFFLLLFDCLNCHLQLFLQIFRRWCCFRILLQLGISGTTIWDNDKALFRIGCMPRGSYAENNRLHI